MVRKNAIPVWYEFNTTYCLKCGNNFAEGEDILNNKFCKDCGEKKKTELKLKGEKVEWREYRSICVNCTKEFKAEDKILFGIYCKKCGKKWVKERELRVKNQLRKARGIPEVELNTKQDDKIERKSLTNETKDTDKTTHKSQVDKNKDTEQSIEKITRDKEETITQNKPKEEKRLKNPKKVDNTKKINTKKGQSSLDSFF